MSARWKPSSDCLSLKRVCARRSRIEVAYLQYTSGSTLFPRGVIITQKAVLANLNEIIIHGLKLRPGDRAFSWLPFYHDMGLVGFVLGPMVSQISVDSTKNLDVCHATTVVVVLDDTDQSHDFL